MMRSFLVVLLALCVPSSLAFTLQPTSTIQNGVSKSHIPLQMTTSLDEVAISRRSLFSSILAAGLVVAASSEPARAESLDLEGYLYRIVRVREATVQERRLIKTGKFKDVQRANVKLAVKFMVQNYRLADCVVASAAYLQGNEKQVRAIDVGQTAVQNLQTILEYFDSQDVQNIKVGADAMAGKEALVLKGLEAAQLKLDEFIDFFPAENVNNVKLLVKQENDLNVKEFDKELGSIVNLAPPS